MQTAITAIRFNPAIGSLKPLMLQLHHQVTLSGKQAGNRVRETGYRMRETALTPVFLLFYNITSNIIPDDAYDWEGDMFEEDHITRVFPLINDGF